VEFGSKLVIAIVLSPPVCQLEHSLKVFAKAADILLGFLVIIHISCLQVFSNSKDKEVH
jgi:hypothetical protein